MKDSTREVSEHFTIKRLSSCLHHENNNTAKEIHFTNQYILYVIFNGCGEKSIDFQEWDIKPGRIFFISPGQVHKFCSDDISGYCIRFDLDFYHSVKSIFKLYDFPFFHTFLMSPYLDIGVYKSEIQSITKRILDEFESGKPFGKWSILRSELENLLIHLTRIRQKQTREDVGILIPNNEKLRNLELLIEQHFKKHKDISFYADQLHISSRHLNNIISEKTGKSISVMIQERVLMETKRHLLHSEKTVAEIAYELGFKDKAYFHRYFKKFINLTPNEFRKAYANKYD